MLKFLSTLLLNLANLCLNWLQLWRWRWQWNGCRTCTMFWWNWGMSLTIASFADAKWVNAWFIYTEKWVYIFFSPNDEIAIANSIQWRRLWLLFLNIFFLLISSVWIKVCPFGQLPWNQWRWPLNWRSVMWTVDIIILVPFVIQVLLGLLAVNAYCNGDG